MNAAGDIPPGVKIVAADAAQSVTLALGSDGRLYMVGDVQVGVNAGAPRLVGHAALPDGVTVTQVAAGRNHQVALGSDRHRPRRGTCSRS